MRSAPRLPLPLTAAGPPAAGLVAVSAAFRDRSRSTPRTFTVKAGHMPLAEAMARRGGATRITGGCSRRERVWAQGD